MDATFLNARITAVQASIVIYEEALQVLGTDGAQSYTLDTGQTRQTVTKLNLTELRKTLDGLYNQYATLEARLNGASVIMGPNW